MANILNFYMDDSGTRLPDNSKAAVKKDRDWFALGGVLISQSDEQTARGAYTSFCQEWDISYPLRSYDIRNHTKGFRWLSQLKEHDFQRYSEFYAALQIFLLNLPLIGIACVIDRTGYNKRYEEEYKQDRWSMCKTAFTIAVERAAKYAAKRGMKLRVLPERCNAKEDNWLLKYYEDLKISAAPFSSATSAKYAPLSSREFADVLYEFKLKDKSSPLAQIADVYLWPICMGGYDELYLPYQALANANRLVGTVRNTTGEFDMGTKYSCFEMLKGRA
jgi:hypothetical protein